MAYSDKEGRHIRMLLDTAVGIASHNSAIPAGDGAMALRTFATVLEERGGCLSHDMIDRLLEITATLREEITA